MTSSIVSIREYFSLPKDLAQVVRYGLTEHTCKSCDGTGEVQARMKHECNCEYCTLEWEEDMFDDLMDCPICHGKGTAINFKMWHEATEILIKMVKESDENE